MNGPGLLRANPGTEYWLRRRVQTRALAGMKRGSEAHGALLREGVDEGLLDDFLDSDRSRKAPADREWSETVRHVGRMIEAGGLVAGGAALRSWRGSGQIRDFDVFFRSFPAFVQATLESRGDPRIDVCLYEETPYEGFDLTPSMVSTDGVTHSPSAECATAFDTGVGSIRQEWVFHPVSTLRRVAKYGREHGVRFPIGEVASVAILYGVRKDVADEALAFAV